MKITKTTISDVAIAAGVSVTTVSDVLNGRDRVAADTAQRVQQVMIALQYRPRPNKRRQYDRRPDLNTRRRSSGGKQFVLLVPDNNPHAAYTNLMRGIAEGAMGYLHQFEHDLQIVSLRPDGSLPYCIEREQVDGVIIRRGVLSDEQIQKLRKYPCVWLFQGDDNHVGDLVTPDNEEIGTMAVRHLRDLGCSQILAVNPDVANISFVIRLSAALHFAERLRMKTHKLSCCNAQSLVKSFANLPAGAEKLGIFISGFTASNTPRIVAETLAATGLGSSVIGAVHETTVDWPYTMLLEDPVRIGRHAAEQLIWRLEHPDADVRKILISPRSILALQRVA